MSSTVYALLVGIDDYGGNPSSLRGCVADIVALGEILATRVGEGCFQPEKLLNREATRQRIIERFEADNGGSFRWTPNDEAARPAGPFLSHEPVGTVQDTMMGASACPPGCQHSNVAIEAAFTGLQRDLLHDRQIGVEHVDESSLEIKRCGGRVNDDERSAPQAKETGLLQALRNTGPAKRPVDEGEIDVFRDCRLSLISGRARKSKEISPSDRLLAGGLAGK